jgi:hypothetical protein
VNVCKNLVNELFRFFAYQLLGLTLTGVTVGKVLSGKAANHTASHC